jgi:hypothetical protein
MPDGGAGTGAGTMGTGGASGSGGSTASGGGTGSGGATGAGGVTGTGGTTGTGGSTGAGGTRGTGGRTGAGGKIGSGGMTGSGGRGGGSPSGEAGGVSGAAGQRGAGGAAVKLPPANAKFDYQIGGAYPPPSGVTVVSRDRGDAPAAGLYNICYVNGFQIQTGEANSWLTGHPDLILRDAGGQPVIDPNWDEMLMDTSTAPKREALLQIVGPWIDGCASRGFDAVEFDNLDSYSRSKGLLVQDNNVAFMGALSARAHAAGLAAGQKNASELVPRAASLGTDFAVTEECQHYNECDVYRQAYGTRVFDIEYERRYFDSACSAEPDLSVVLRDLDVTPSGSATYVFDAC